MESLALTEQAIQEFTTVTEALKSAVAAACQEKLAELMEAKEQLNKELPLSLAEVEGTLEESQPRVTIPYATLLRDLVECPSLFTYRKIPASEVNVPFESSFPQPDQLLLPVYFPSIFENTVRLYNAKTRKYTKKTLSVNFGKDCHFLLLNRNKLMCL